MLLKPATPLTILLLVSFALLLLSCLSTPVVKGIPLATYNNVDYGVFGYCQGNTCSKIQVGYSTHDITFSGSDFNLPSSTRKSLSAILIVHPVAAFLNLICLALAAASHFHAPSHSPRFLLALLILLLPTLLVTLLAFLVDILLFVPHLNWGGWIVLGATIILVSCGVVTCAMRRTLVSRKARKRRIAENAEMSGENYRNRQNAATAAVAANTMAADSLPETKEPIITASSSLEPNVATFRTTTHDSDDDRTPLNSNIGSREHVPMQTQYSQAQYPDVYSATAGPGGQPRRNVSDPRLRPQYSGNSVASRRGGTAAGYAPRGRGGYQPRGGNSYGQVGTLTRAPGGTGGYLGPVPPRGPRGGRGSRAGMGYHHPPRPNRSFDSNSQTSDQPYDAHAIPINQPSSGPIGMAISPETVGAAIELMPARYYDVHDSMISTDSQPHALDPQINRPLSPTSLYSRTESYVPARAGWGPSDVRHAISPRPSPGPPSPGYPPRRSPQPTLSPVPALNVSRGANYYEDAEPRFSSVRLSEAQNDKLYPPSLMPGGQF
ncbi:hypothetical protein N7495_009602 [Penicillium taxi]|uniref:uncharacterized protein n=1 Tax=Penicillium taxi TaxID=168475 RepID=UPI002544E7DC|nr:uncharacterized protein N7495_009602 [Penicillium taxi]KAJ5885092.1 hypothetical protein N7495_009602 [Penicillium taxi]